MKQAPHSLITINKEPLDARFKCATLAEADSRAYDGYTCYVVAEKRFYKYVLVNDTLVRTTDDNVDTSTFATKTELNAKADKTYVNTELGKKADSGHTHTGFAPAVHSHDYIPNATLPTLALKSDLDGKANATHNHDTAYAPASHGHSLYQNAIDTINNTINSGRLSSTQLNTDFLPRSEYATNGNYVHPDTHPSSMITETSEKRFTSNAEMDSKANTTYVDNNLSSLHSALQIEIDNARTGLDQKTSCRAATTEDIVLSGLQTVDGVNVGVGDRVLVKNKTNGALNGIYIASTGEWTRATDFDNTPNTEVKQGVFVFVNEGTVNKNSGWRLTTYGNIVIGTTSLSFEQFNGLGDLATETTNGLLSALDKAKLNTIESGATNTPLSNATPQILGTASAGVSSEASRADHVHSKPPLATSAMNGLMASTDKVKIDRDLKKTPQTLTDGATITWNMANGYNAVVTLGGNRTLAFSNLEAGDIGTLVVKQDATGNRTLTLPSGSKKANGGFFLSTTANAIDILSFYYDGTNYYWNIGKLFS